MITAAEIASLSLDSTDYKEAERLKAKFAELRRCRQPLFLTSQEFDEILVWKLGQQYGRQRHLRRANYEELIRAVTGLALNLSHVEEEYELELRVNVLCALRGVGVPVASAILALIFPEKYAVIDSRDWQQIFGKEANGFGVNDYKKYMHEIRRLANELGWMPQQVDHAIWEYDKRTNRNKQPLAIK